jgi:hypothetical protein
MDYDAAGANVLAEILRQFEQRTRDAAAEWQKAPGRDCRIGLAQPCGEQRDQGLVDLRMCRNLRNRRGRESSRRRAGRHY